MAPEKRNHFLDADDSDDDKSQGYNSEADEVTKGGRSAKRRKLESDSDNEDDFTDAEEELEPSVQSPTQDSQLEAGESAKDDESASLKSKKKPRDVVQIKDSAANPLKKNLVVTPAQIKKSGVVYLSRIPPFMKPSKLRSLLVPYGRINRIFLSPEDPDARKRRMRAGGNKKRTYVDGWVEFVDKKDAKAAAEVLNGNTIGGKKGSYYRDDLWTMLYLKGYKWHNLMEQIATENKERENRMRAEIVRTTKENTAFVRQVEKAKVLEGIQSKRSGKQNKEKADGVDGGAGAVVAAAPPARSMTFEQLNVASHKKAAEPSAEAKKTLSRLF